MGTVWYSRTRPGRREAYVAEPYASAEQAAEQAASAVPSGEETYRKSVREHAAKPTNP